MLSCVRVMFRNRGGGGVLQSEPVGGCDQWQQHFVYVCLHLPSGCSAADVDP